MPYLRPNCAKQKKFLLVRSNAYSLAMTCVGLRHPMTTRSGSRSKLVPPVLKGRPAQREQLAQCLDPPVRKVQPELQVQLDLQVRPERRDQSA
jgi:hypothetical protein